MEKEIKYTFPAVFRPEEAGGYIVSFPQLDGCFTQGDTFEEARQMAVEAMSLHLYGMEEDNEMIPAPSMDIETNKGELVVPITAWMTPYREEMENRAVKRNHSK